MAADAAFKGSIPEMYGRFGVPLIFAPYAADLAARLAGMTQGRVLETAAGTGVVTRAMLAALPDAVAITATDLSQPMLDLAAAQTPPSSRVTWRQADAQALPFPDAAFDALVCQFGVMFLPDRARAFAEAFRVLRPGGRFLFNVWDRIEESPLIATAAEALAARFPDDPPSFMRRTPHGHYQVAPWQEALRQAGFTAIAHETVTCRSAAPGALAVASFVCHGTPTRAEIEARAPGQLDAVTDVVAAAVARRHGTSEVSGPIQAIVFSATR